MNRYLINMIDLQRTQELHFGFAEFESLFIEGNFIHAESSAHTPIRLVR